MPFVLKLFSLIIDIFIMDFLGISEICMDTYLFVNAQGIELMEERNRKLYIPSSEIK